MAELEFTRDARELINLSNRMKELMLDENFAAFQDVLKKSIEVWTLKAVAPALSRDGLVEGEFNKGTLYGIRLILDLPSRIITEAKDVISRQETSNERSVDFTRPGQHFDAERPGARFSDSPESIAEQLGEPVGPNARVTADSNT